MPSSAQAKGLARNTAAPFDVLSHLLEAWPDDACAGLRRRDELARPLQEAMATHSSRHVRATLAEHPGVDPDIRERLLTDPEWWVWIRAFDRPGQRPVSDGAVVRLLSHIDRLPEDVPFTRDEMFHELVDVTRFDDRLFRLAATHPEPGVREFAAGSGRGDEPWRQDLLADPVPEVRRAAARFVTEQARVMLPADLPAEHCHAFWLVLQRPLSQALVDHVMASGDVAALEFVGRNPTTPAGAVETLSRHPDAGIRRSVARRDDLTGEQLLRLAADPAVEVRTEVSTHPSLSEEQRGAIAIDVTVVPCDGCYGPNDERRCRMHVSAGIVVPDLERAARSVNPLLRRAAARRRDLPAHLVPTLADDPDLGVRVLLAQHHPDAPPPLLLRCFLEYRGCGRDRLSSRPRFPVEGLARFADHADPAVRRLVARDPLADPRLVERLVADPDATVRQAMASCPRLPAARIAALLDHPDLAEHAAANPAMPVAEMWRVLTRR